MTKTSGVVRCIRKDTRNIISEKIVTIETVHEGKNIDYIINIDESSYPLKVNDEGYIFILPCLAEVKHPQCVNTGKAYNLFEKKETIGDDMIFIKKILAYFNVLPFLSPQTLAILKKYENNAFYDDYVVLNMGE